MLKFFGKLAQIVLRVLLIYLALHLVDEEALSEEIPSGKIATDSEPLTTSIKGIVEQVMVWFTVYLHKGIVEQVMVWFTVYLHKGIVEQVMVWFTVYLHSHCTIQAATTQPVLTKAQVTLPYYMCSCELGIFF